MHLEICTKLLDTVTQHVRLPLSHAFEMRSVLSQDHYVEITTANGKVLLRVRLADVANQLSEIGGIMPHRSHWVAKSAVIGLAGNANKKMLVLDSGIEVPVARGRVADVKNWLEG